MAGLTESNSICVGFLAVRRSEMEKAVNNVHLWLDRTRNNYVKTPFPHHMRDIPRAQTFIFVSSKIMAVGKRENYFSTKD